MASPPNIKRLALCFLFSALLLLMQGHRSSARNMKEKQEMPAQNDDSKSNQKKTGEDYFPIIYGNNKRDEKKTSEDYFPIIYGNDKRDHKKTSEDYFPIIYGKDKSVPKGRGEDYFPIIYGNDKRDPKGTGEDYWPIVYGNEKRDQKVTSEHYFPIIYGNDKRGQKETSEDYFPIIYGNDERDQKKTSEDYFPIIYGNDKRNQKKTSEDYFPIIYNNDKRDQKKTSEDYFPIIYGNDKRDQKETSEHYFPIVYGNDKRDRKETSEDYFPIIYANDKRDQKKTSEDYFPIIYGNDKRHPKQTGEDHLPFINEKRDQKKTGEAYISKVDHTKAIKKLFFTLDDLYIGNTMTLQFPLKEFPGFLPKKEADSIPFSMSQLPRILQLLSISADSPMAQAMKSALDVCEYEPMKWETKACVTSVESMLEFVRKIIGSETNLNVLSTNLPTTSSARLQNYTVLQVSQDIYAPQWVVCHPMPYPYGLYYCHFINSGTKVFKVLLAAENGDKIEVPGICHLDTSEWKPDIVPLQLLGLKPGEAPVCHFFLPKTFVWVPQPPKATS